MEIIHWALSHQLAMKKCVQIAKNGVAIAGIYNSNHFGMAANYLERLQKIIALHGCLLRLHPLYRLMALWLHISVLPPFAFGAPTATKINHLY